jgi:hypothetical protein
MILKDFLPNSAFRAFIRCYRIVHLEFDKFAEFPFKIYTPKPEECLSFYLKDREEIELIGYEKKDYNFTVGLFGQLTSITKRYAGKSFLSISSSLRLLASE